MEKLDNHGERIVELENKMSDMDLSIKVMRHDLNHFLAKNHVHEKIGGKTSVHAPLNKEWSKKLAEAVGEVNQCNNNRFEEMDKHLHQLQTTLADLTNTWKKIGGK